MTVYIVHLLIGTLLFAAMASSYNLLLGIGRLFSIAQAAFVGIGAYAVGAGTLNFNLPFPATVVIGLVAGCAIGLVLGAVALRVADVYLAIASFAFQQLFVSAVINLKSITSGGYGLPGIPPPQFGPITFDTPYHQLAAALVVLGITLEVNRRLDRSPFGRMMRCSGEDEVAVRALGKSVWQGKLVIFTVSGALAALAGAFYSSFIGFIDPTTFTIDMSILLLSMVILGGAGTIFGPVLGAVLIVDLPEVLSFVGVAGPQVSNVRQAAYGLALLLVVVVAKRGILVPRIAGGRGRSATVPGEHELERTVGSAIAVHDVSKRFGGVTAINKLSLSINPGRVTGIVGPNGAGKTTLFDILTGFVRPDSGEVRVDGRSIGRQGPEERARNGIVRSFQDLKLFPGMSALENIRLAFQSTADENPLVAMLTRRRVRRIEVTTMARAQALLETIGFDGDPDLPAEELSYAEQKLLSLARAIAASPRVLLLDEPASGLDHASLLELAQVIRGIAERGTTVCVIEHNVSLLSQLADHMLFLHLGSLSAEGDPASIMGNPKLSDIYFGLEAV
jgi:branched-chain amino acid transport system permease protein